MAVAFPPMWQPISTAPTDGTTGSAQSARKWPSAELEGMLKMRMRSAPESFFPHWHAHKHNDKVVLLVVTSDGKSVVLEDEWALYPSDALVTKLRLLEK